MEATRRGAAVQELVAVMKRLLAPDGCPWDREQTLDTLKPFLLEETYEVIEAIEDKGPAEHCEELGDLLMQIVFQSELREAEGAFTMDDVARGIAEKLVRRHPHVFGEAAGTTGVKTSEQVLEQWDQLKAREKPARQRTLDGIPRALPALPRSFKISERVTKVGFDWPDVAGCRAKVVEELEEIDRAAASGDRAALEHEVGDLFFAAASLARKLGVDPEQALRGANSRFQKRFEFIEDQLRVRGRTPRESNLEEMDALWNEAKAAGIGVPEK